MARKRHLHPAQGVYLGFYLSQLTQRKGFSPAFVFSADRTVLLNFPCGPEVLVPTGFGREPQLSPTRVHARTYTFFFRQKNCANYTPLHSSRWFSNIRGCIVGPQNYTPTVHQPFTKNLSPPRPQQPTSPPPETGTSWGLPHRHFPKC